MTNKNPTYKGGKRATNKSYVAIRREAANLYIYQGLSIRELCDRFKLTPGTMGKWSKTYEWVKLRENYLRSKAAELDQLLEARQSLVAELVTARKEKNDSSSICDQLSKIDKVIQNCQTDMVSAAIITFQALIPYLGKNFMSTLKDIEDANILPQFLDFLRTDQRSRHVDLRA